MHHRTATGLAAILIALGAASLPAQGANTSDQPGSSQCYLSGMAFSAGAVARVGTNPKICGAAGTWLDTDEQTAGCIQNSRFYATGTRLPIEKAPQQVLECLSDGTWSPVPHKDAQPSAH